MKIHINLWSEIYRIEETQAQTMNITLTLKKGLDLHIAGAPEGDPDKAETIRPRSVALTPEDFPGLALKPIVREGETVAQGQPVLQDKHNPLINITAPASGTVKEIVRGERRKLERIVIEATQADGNCILYNTDSIDSPEEARTLLQSTGLWAMIRQRPYNIVPPPDSIARDIFISTWDSAPLAPDTDSILATRQAEMKAGVKLLARLTHGTIYIARKANSLIPDIHGATMINVSGPHPAGLAGVIAANIKPVNKGETIWTLDGLTLARIGRLATTGRLDTSCVIAITGSEVSDPGYIKTLIGADIETLIKDRLKKSDHHERIISGNVLTGVTVKRNLYLRYPFTQISVIPEGDDIDEFMGWASLSPKKMSTSRSFPGHFLFKKLFKPDARLLGGRRAMIMSGQYDKVIPMDIMAEYLVKAILSRDIEKMESLGIYEVAPEDFAVAEYVCTSKMPLQSIVAHGLEYIRKELE